MKILLCVALLFAPGALLASDLTFGQAKAQADRDEQSLSDEQEALLLASQGEVAHPTFAGCKASDLVDRRRPFTVVMELDGTGRVRRTWLSGTSAIAGCMHEALRVATLFRPPHAPFYSSFEYRFAER